MRGGIVVAAALALLAQRALAQDTFVVEPKTVADEKAVFATVESANVVPARARIGGTVVELAVKEGDAVKQGQIVATIGDEKLALQMKSLDAQISGLEAQFAQAQTDLTRAEDLFAKGTIPKTNLDQARTAFNVASNTLKARTAERSVIQQQVTEGNVLAPTAGRVLKVPLTTGTVILPGETVATVAERNFILRLRVPERHARFLKNGDPVRIDRRGARQERRAIRHHPPGLSADRGWPRDRRCRGRRSRRLFRRRAYPRLGLGRRARELHRAGLVHRHALRHRLCPRSQECRSRSTCRCSAGASCRARTCRTHWKSSPDFKAGDVLVQP